MILTQILQPSCICAPLKSKDKESVIEELVTVLASAGQVKDANAALEAVMEREQTRSTGIGSGIAIPHGKCTAVKELVMAVGIAAQPVDFASIDNKPVNIVVMLISPPDKTGPHIQALARISRLLLDDQFKAKLEKVTSPEEAYQLISAKETE
ncbi:MAG: PTS sugar transporter subunit IIA [Sedimentisphaerales bacterium]|nr:PTS sugar transporter subunit IIA [Sedimentisphaerales bacterium]